MRRIACVALPQIRVEIVRERENCQATSPLAVVVARPASSVKTERDVLGNTRIDVVSREARAVGVRAGQTVAAARAKCAELRVRVVAEGAVVASLARIAEAALAIGPATAFDASQDVVFVDVGGCAHLHGGEGELARVLEARVQSLGHACRIAVADGPRIAAAVARFAPARQRGPLVVPRGKGAAAMRVLPVAALALGEDATAWLADLGLPTCGDLQKLPRRALGTRLGERAHDVMQLLDGEDRAPLDAWRPPEVPEERVELEWGAHSIDALAFVLKMLSDRLAVRLEGRAMAAARLEVELSLDRALCDGAPHRTTLSIVLPAPIARAVDLLGVLRARLEHHTLAAPVLGVTLRAPELSRRSTRTLDLLSPEPKADRALPRLVAELAAEIGASQVGMLALADTWVPHDRTRLVPFGASRDVPRHALTMSSLEPTRLVEPTHVKLHALADAKLLARVDGIEWWKRGVVRRDLVAAWIGSRQSGAHAWVELTGLTGEDALLRGWID
jgi:protein ImuB